MSFQQIVQAEFQPYGSLTPSQLGELEQHYQLMTRWNQRLNLTRISEIHEVVRFHYCESLFVGTVLPPGPLKVADLGSGAGFPGIPLAIFRPDLQIILVESDARKSVFLREAARGLSNVRVAQSRVEELTQHIDWAVARAVSPNQILESGLAENFALLMSSEGLPPVSKVIRLPWGRDRLLVVSGSTWNVPRGTPKRMNPKWPR